MRGGIGGDLIQVYKYVKGTDPGTVGSFVRRRGNGHKLESEGLPLNITNHFFAMQVTKNWHRFSRELEESPVSEIFESCLNVNLSNPG